MTRLLYELDLITQAEELRGERDALRKDVARLKQELKAAKAQAGMADACLHQVRDWLASHGIDVTHTPPMYFPEACQTVLARILATGCGQAKEG